jgi:hypothetical protein
LARAHWPDPYPKVPLPPLACANANAPLAIDIIDDRSSSTYANDPQHRREPELRQVISWLGESDCHPADAVSIQQFDDVIPPLGRTPLTSDQAQEDVFDALPDQAPESSSTLTPTLRRATAWAAKHPKARNVLVVATDGELTDFPDALAAIDRYPGSIHILSLGGELPAEWDNVSRVHVTKLQSTARFGDIARSLAKEVAAESHKRSKGEGHP